MSLILTDGGVSRLKLDEAFAVLVYRECAPGLRLHGGFLVAMRANPRFGMMRDAGRLRTLGFFMTLQ